MRYTHRIYVLPRLDSILMDSSGSSLSCRRPTCLSKKSRSGGLQLTLTTSRGPFNLGAQAQKVKWPDQMMMSFGATSVKITSIRMWSPLAGDLIHRVRLVEITFTKYIGIGRQPIVSERWKTCVFVFASSGRGQLSHKASKKKTLASWAGVPAGFLYYWPANWRPIDGVRRQSPSQGGLLPRAGWILHLPVPLRPGVLATGSLIRNKLRWGFRLSRLTRIVNTKQIETWVRRPLFLKRIAIRKKLRWGLGPSWKQYLNACVDCDNADRCSLREEPGAIRIYLSPWVFVFFVFGLVPKTSGSSKEAPATTNEEAAKGPAYHPPIDCSRLGYGGSTLPQVDLMLEQYGLVTQILEEGTLQPSPGRSNPSRCVGSYARCKAGSSDTRRRSCQASHHERWIGLHARWWCSNAYRH